MNDDGGPAPGSGSDAGKDGEGAQGDVRAAEARLAELRRRLEILDEELIRLVGRRRDLVVEVGAVKEILGRPVLDPTREARVVRRAAERARALGVDEELVRDVVWRIMASAREAQTGRTEWGPSAPSAPPGREPEEPGEDRED